MQMVPDVSDVAFLGVTMTTNVWRETERDREESIKEVEGVE